MEKKSLFFRKMKIKTIYTEQMCHYPQVRHIPVFLNQSAQNTNQNDGLCRLKKYRFEISIVSLK